MPPRRRPLPRGRRLLGGSLYFDIAPAIAEIGARGLPVATTFGDPAAPGVPNASVSQEAVGEVAARHLLARGCRRPLLLPSLGFSGRIGERRLAGFREALAAAGVRLLDEAIAGRAPASTLARPVVVARASTRSR